MYLKVLLQNVSYPLIEGENTGYFLIQTLPLWNCEKETMISSCLVTVRLDGIVDKRKNKKDLKCRKYAFLMLLICLLLSMQILNCLVRP